MKTKCIPLTCFVFWGLFVFGQSNANNPIDMTPFDQPEGIVSTSFGYPKMNAKKNDMILKSGTEARFRLDSIIIHDSVMYEFTYNSEKRIAFQFNHIWNPEEGNWSEKNKTEYVYDSEGNLVIESVYKWDSGTGQWIDDFGYVYYYDESNNMIRKVSSYYDFATSTWIKNDKVEYTYDNQGNIISKAYYFFYNNAWVGHSEKLVATYNENGYKTLDITYNFDQESGSWVPSSKREFFYDAFSRKDYILMYGWNQETGDWNECSAKIEFTYNNISVLISEINYSWDPHLGAWVEFWKYESETNFQGNILSTIFSLRNIETGDMQEMQKTIYEYDSNDNLVLIENYSFDDIVSHDWIGTSKYEYGWDVYGNRILAVSYGWGSDEWKPKEKEEDLFDSVGNKLLHAKYKWNSKLQDWDGVEKYEYDFNFDYSSDEIIVPYWLQFANMPTGMQAFEWEDNSWVPDYYQTNYYSDLKTGIENPTNSFPSVFPNPFTDRLFIQAKENSSVYLEILDSNGQILFSKKIIQPITLNLDWLKSGAYFYRIVSGNNYTNGKLIKY